MLQTKNIQNTQDIHGYLKSAQPSDLVVFDVDQVLIDPTDVILSANGEALKAKLLADISTRLGPTKYETLYSTLIKARQVQLIDPCWPECIWQLQINHIPTIGLTAFWSGQYGVIENMGEFRVEQLKKLGITFDIAPPNNNTTFSHLSLKKINKPPIFKNGILITNYVCKGEVLKYFLKNLEIKPKRIIFIEDRLPYLEAVQAICKQANIEFLGLHYTVAYTNELNTQQTRLGHFQFQHLETHKEWLDDNAAIKLFNQTISSN